MIGHIKIPAKTLVLMVVVIAVFQVHSVFANVPSVDSIIPWTRQSDQHTILNITVNHLGYFSGHYVDWVKVNVTGGVHQIDLTQPQPVNLPFVVQYDMGVLETNPFVNARAHCTQHFEGSWSPLVQVPEFSIVQLLGLFAVLSVVVVLLSRKIHKSKYAWH